MEENKELNEEVKETEESNTGLESGGSNPELESGLESGLESNGVLDRDTYVAIISKIIEAKSLDLSKDVQLMKGRELLGG